MPDNEFGYTPWGMGWVRLAEPIRTARPEPLLPRARSIARNGGVRLDVDGTTVSAHIHRGGQASVTLLEIAPLPASVVTAMAAHIPAHLVQLTDEVHAVLTAAGLAPIPRLGATDCSCSARNPRCLHLLAACYALARAVDENPWLSLDLQGYRSGGTPETGAADARPPRWTPLDSLDPATFFTGMATAEPVRRHSAG
ncbi:SWIM zinc finger family protein [Nocardia mikamii]|uniref:SWIM zinc finger family protein n=1 Tax=Nocardia mikamii TaxID=508464 RepID=UPI0007A3F1BE|nr:SWIM zinc finger family protein [Nocardia mikamii]